MFCFASCKLKLETEEIEIEGSLCSLCSFADVYCADIICLVLMFTHSVFGTVRLSCTRILYMTVQSPK